MSTLPLTYPVADIFGPTVQGEGHFVGYPMVFVRLAGCSVTQCTIRSECDEAPWKMKARLSLDQIIDGVRLLCPSGIVLITGGEPTDHDLVPLVARLRDSGYRVHLETSGVRSVAGLPLEWLTVSPKTLDYQQRAGHTLKVVIRPEWDWPEVLHMDRGTDFFHRYLQPLTDGTGRAVNLPQVLEMVTDTTHNGDARWALSTQSHRYWKVK